MDIIHEPASGYEQKKWVNRMIDLAIKKHHADWIINADADEFWYSPKGNLKAEFAHTHATIMRCPVRVVYPTEGTDWHTWNRIACPIDNSEYEKRGLSPYCIFERQSYKITHRAKGFLDINMGNHKAKMLPYFLRPNHIEIYHYSVRKREDFISKIIQGGRELQKHKGQHGGRHWRYFYQIYIQGEDAISKEYDRVVGSEQLQSLSDEGYIYEDNTMANLFAKIESDKSMPPKIELK